jgi:hypothetical protein
MSNSPFRFAFHYSLLVSLCLGIWSQTRADEPNDLMQRFLTDDVVAVVYLDLQKIDPPAIAKASAEFGVQEPELTRIQAATAAAKLELDNLTGAGVRYVFAFLRTTDFNQLGTSWVASIQPHQDPDRAAQLVRDLITKTGLNSGAKELIAGVRVVDGYLVAAANDAQVARMANEKPTDPRDVSAAMAALGKGAVGIVLVGDADSRRVIRELVPRLPSPLDSITGTMIADDLLWGGIQLDWPPKLGIKLEIECRSPNAATVVSQALTDAADTFSQSAPFLAALEDPKARKLVRDAFNPSVKQNRVTVSLESVTGDLQRLASVLAKPIEELRQSARTTAEMNNLRQLMLGILNYESAFGQFPNPSGITENTPAGLSWRVQILPFLEQGELYDKFKLDEPWNSEHNLRLVAEMPEIFKSPLVRDPAIHTAGKTIYQVPVADAGMFKPNNLENVPVKFGDITDGSSNTICIVATDEANAVVWTKPQDWSVDLENPRAGLDREQIKMIIALTDASVHVLPQSITAKQLRALITSAGSEIIDFAF